MPKIIWLETETETETTKINEKDPLVFSGNMVVLFHPPENQSVSPLHNQFNCVLIV